MASEMRPYIEAGQSLHTRPWAKRRYCMTIRRGKCGSYNSGPSGCFQNDKSGSRPGSSRLCLTGEAFGDCVHHEILLFFSHPREDGKGQDMLAGILRTREGALAV